ncbi:MAG: hypothetical protein ACYC8T_33545 [Myxococcaceae bacterium]
MKTRLPCLLAVLTLASPALAQIQINIPLPSIHFEVAPPLVIVAPGIQVVPDYHEEVFFTDGWYWYRQEDRWYQARDYRGGWVVVEHKRVPPGLTRMPPGHYKKFKRGGPPPPPSAIHRASSPVPQKQHGGDHHDDHDEGHGKSKGKGKKH